MIFPMTLIIIGSLAISLDYRIRKRDRKIAILEQNIESLYSENEFLSSRIKPLEKIINSRYGHNADS